MVVRRAESMRTLHAKFSHRLFSPALPVPPATRLLSVKNPR